MRFFTRDEIEILWKAAGFRNIKIDSLTRTDNDGHNTIGYFIVEAEK